MTGNRTSRAAAGQHRVSIVNGQQGPAHRQKRRHPPARSRRQQEANAQLRHSSG